MIFDKLVALKISLDFYRESRNPLKKILYHLLLRSIINRIKIIKKSIISFEVLSEFQGFISVIDPDNNGNIKGYEYEYGLNKHAQEIVIVQSGLGNITILLRHHNNSIEVEYPLSPRSRVDKIYKYNIDDPIEVIRDRNTAVINSNIRNYIYDYITSYMKGEFDNEGKSIEDDNSQNSKE